MLKNSLFSLIYIVLRTTLIIFKDDSVVEGGTGKLGIDQ
jgi:hypothetical protein